MFSAILPDIPSPWREFLAEVDEMLTEEVRIDCVGGFVITILYRYPRPTSDLDYIETVPDNAADTLQQIAGEGSPLHKKYGLYFQKVTGITSLPESYKERLTEISPGAYRHLRLFALEPHDLALSKLTRNNEIDRGDVEFLAKTVPLDPNLLRTRYEREFRPGALGDPRWNDQTLELWIEAYFVVE